MLQRFLRYLKLHKTPYSMFILVWRNPQIILLRLIHSSSKATLSLYNILIFDKLLDTRVVLIKFWWELYSLTLYFNFIAQGKREPLKDIKRQNSSKLKIFQFANLFLESKKQCFILVSKCSLLVTKNIKRLEKDPWPSPQGTLKINVRNHDLVVNAEDSQPKGHGFEPLHRILDVLCWLWHPV